MHDEVMVLMVEAKNRLLEERAAGVASRESSVALTNLETACLWRALVLDKQERAQHEPAVTV